ncbi:peptidylprolyl isomerase [Anaeramoeba flamelloides]|uniref:Peptidylprolyl isomerase n=1 Tax=Anaeramoeba flamelloides TaxID=1746091 RepID=A0ABQ8YVD7_9EUKA|nr:peptidylprolyl isomerase [Anaeramoeba flamelloides]
MSQQKKLSSSPKRFTFYLPTEITLKNEEKPTLSISPISQPEPFYEKEKYLSLSPQSDNPLSDSVILSYIPNETISESRSHSPIRRDSLSTRYKRSKRPNSRRARRIANRNYLSADPEFDYKNLPPLKIEELNQKQTTMFGFIDNQNNSVFDQFLNINLDEEQNYFEKLKKKKNKKKKKTRKKKKAQDQNNLNNSNKKQKLEKNNEIVHQNENKNENFNKIQIKKKKNNFDQKNFKKKKKKKKKRRRSKYKGSRNKDPPKNEKSNNEKNN